MEIYRYGPLIFVTQGMDDDQGNYFWNGNPPVGYDEDGIPIDKNGYQCLDISCPLHPSYEPTETRYSDVLKSDIPTKHSFSKWFEDNFLIITEEQLTRYIFRWWSRKHRGSPLYMQVLNNYSSVKDILGDIWQEELT